MRRVCERMFIFNDPKVAFHDKYLSMRPAAIEHLTQCPSTLVWTATTLWFSGWGSGRELCLLPRPCCWCFWDGDSTSIRGWLAATFSLPLPSDPPSSPSTTATRDCWKILRRGRDRSLQSSLWPGNQTSMSKLWRHSCPMSHIFESLNKLHLLYWRSSLFSLLL